MAKNYFSLYSFDKPQAPWKGTTLITIGVLASGLLMWRGRFVRAAEEVAVPLPLPTVATPVAAPEKIIEASLATSLDPRRTLEAAAHPRSKSTPISTVPRLPAYVFIFQGEAACAGRPVQNARVQVRLTSPHDSRSFAAMTDEDGHFSLKTHLRGIPNESVDWTLEAEADHYQTLQSEGRKIITGDNQTATTLQQHLEFSTI